MAYPFGEIPTFGTFKAWAAQEGFAVKNGTIVEDGRSIKITMFVPPDGGDTVPIAHILDGERLLPTQVNYLERRLKVKSPFPSFAPSETFG